MKKIILGTALGLAIGYLTRKMQEEGFLDQMSDDLDKLTSKTKKKFKNAVDVGENEVEYIKEQTQKISE